MSGLFTAGLAATVLGTGVGMYANHEQLSDQDKIAAQGLARQQALQSQANATTQQAIKKVGDDNAANIERNKVQQQAQYAQALQRAMPVQSASLSTTPGASSRYNAGVVDAQTANKQYGAQQAADAAAVNAPQLTGAQDALSMGDAATKLGLINDTSQREAALTKGMVSGVASNPWLGAAASLLKGAGSAAMANSGTGTGTGTGVGTNTYGANIKTGVGVQAGNGLGSATGGLA